MTNTTDQTKINYYKLEKRSEIIASNLPQRDFKGLIEGYPVRFDIVRLNDIPCKCFNSQGVVYRDCYIKIPSEIGAINVHYNGKYGVSLDSDGFVSLAVKQ